jgi:processive 1,2-diacylglycerol beta-glucosyltransferase
VLAAELFTSYSQVWRQTGPALNLKKILILTAGFGEGEDVAAWNVREALELLAPEQARLEVLDLLDSCYGRFHDALRHTFQAAINHAPRLWHGFYQLLGHSQLVEDQLDGLARLRHSLRDVLRSLEPDVVVSTCPIYGFLIEEIYRDGRSRDFTLISLVTDAVVKDSPWPRSASDFYAVANETVARVLSAAGVPEKKIEVFGFPVQFYATSRREKQVDLPDLAVRDSRPRILYIINSARKKAPKLLDRLLEHPGWDVTVCVGRDTDLEAMALGKAATAPESMEVIGNMQYLRRMPQLLREHHVVISKAEAALVQEAIAARCPLIVPKLGSGQEEANFSLLREANAGALAAKPKEVADWLERAFRDEGRLLALWRKNLEPLGKPDSALNLARFILEQAATVVPVPKLRALPAPGAVAVNASKNQKANRLRRLPKKLLLCDLHTHTSWSDGKLTVPEMVDFYGQRGFDCLCITDHLCDPKRLLGKLVNLTGMVIPPGEVESYFEEIEREKKRAWAKYDLMLMAGVEFNKDGYTARTSTHLLGVDLKQPIDPSLELRDLIAEIHAQGALAIASHPHETKSEWGRDTLYLWEHVDEYAPLLDAWEVANRDDIFNPVGLKKLPFVANSDFHKPKHIHSWKTLLYCEKEAEAIKHCIRVNRDVSITLYRDHRFGIDERNLHVAALKNGPEMADYAEPRLAARQG